MREPRYECSGFRLMLAAAAALVLTGALPLAHAAASRSALSGQVTSPTGSPMEGVVVGAARAGSAITVEVVSNRQGDYDFPASRMGPGRYQLRIRAAGYALAGPGDVTVRAGSTTTANLSRRTVKD